MKRQKGFVKEEESEDEEQQDVESSEDDVEGLDESEDDDLDAEDMLEMEAVFGLRRMEDLKASEGSSSVLCSFVYSSIFNLKSGKT